MRPGCHSIAQHALMRHPALARKNYLPLLAFM